MSTAQAPSWEYWNEAGGAQAFKDKELTLVQPPKAVTYQTLYRNDYPPPPLYWEHKPAKQIRHGQVAPFGHTSSHRDDFIDLSAKMASSKSVRPEYPSSNFKPKFSTATTSRVDFPPPPLTVPKYIHTDRSYKPNNADLGTTTMRADYKQWPVQERSVRAQPPLSQFTNKFQSMTTSRNDFQPPAEIPPPPHREPRKPHAVPSFDGTTEYRAQYEPIRLPPGAFGAIGLQIATRPYKQGGVGGQFEPMIRQGAAAPQQANKTFTTVVDNQTTAAIVIVTKRDDRADGVILGHFSLHGISKAPVGIPKVEVSLRLTSEKTLVAAATYLQGNKKKALTFVSAGPNLRSVTVPDEVPHDSSY